MQVGIVPLDRCTPSVENSALTPRLKRPTLRLAARRYLAVQSAWADVRAELALLIKAGHTVTDGYPECSRVGEVPTERVPT